MLHAARLRDGVGAVGVAAVVVAELWGGWPGMVLGLGLTAIAYAAARRAPVWTLAAGSAANLVIPIGTNELPVWPILLSILAALVAGRRMPRAAPAAVVFGLVALAGLGLAVAGLGDLWAWIEVLIPLAVFAVLPWWAGQYARQRAALVEAGWLRAEQLERERQLVAEEARLRERTRIARDMHDSLGHELSLIALRAGALELDSHLSEDHRTAAADVRVAAADATERLREIIGVLAGDAGPEVAPTEPHVPDLVELVRRTRDSGMAVSLSGSAADDLPAMGRLSAYRIVQEALTNAAKHAPGAAVTVDVRRVGDRVTVTVRNGPGGPATVEPGGRGLVGMTERARLAGGTLRAGPIDGGFELVAELPVDGAPPMPPPPPPARESARRSVRRTLWGGVAVQLAAFAAIGLIVLGLRVYEVTTSYVDTAAYQSFQLGQLRSDLDLPSHQVDGRPEVTEPAAPDGAECEYYRVNTDLFAGPIDVYRLCFRDGRLVTKDLIPGRSR
ncbi:MAG: sensor histidine kinase [Hamadaea sp.]|uniref:sensor histidine kinase n=1 Tax=Hamadaea sp. TaxID=2024425 RepID=UPI00181C4AE9|nr:histidine kinase [Hamadaea sp.]NUR71028.1 sensor histidine kinase [Hamadaea sp.]NUT23709.1 sensor histidine kinase [Hamadaea sp.]